MPRSLLRQSLPQDLLNRKTTPTAPLPAASLSCAINHNGRVALKTQGLP